MPRIFCQSKDFSTLFRCFNRFSIFRMENPPSGSKLYFSRGSLVKFLSVSAFQKLEVREEEFYENCYQGVINFSIKKLVRFSNEILR